MKFATKLILRLMGRERYSLLSLIRSKQPESCWKAQNFRLLPSAWEALKASSPTLPRCHMRLYRLMSGPVKESRTHW